MYLKTSKPFRILLFIISVINITYLQVQSVHFQNYKASNGRPFTLHKDLVTENLPPVSSGLIYNQKDIKNLILYPTDSGSIGVESINPWNGAVCYFPQAIWNNTQEKLKLYNSTEKSILNETLGVWYFYPEGQPDRDGNWWNSGDGVSKKNSIYYIKLR